MTNADSTLLGCCLIKAYHFAGALCENGGRRYSHPRCTKSARGGGDKCVDCAGSAAFRLISDIASL